MPASNASYTCEWGMHATWTQPAEAHAIHSKCVACVNVLSHLSSVLRTGVANWFRAVKPSLVQPRQGSKSTPCSGVQAHRS